MIGNRRILAIVAARGGSKGFPGKNIAPLGGRPVLAWSVAAAHASKLIDRTILSSDDMAIMEAGRAAGCEVPFVRPAEFATDDASMVGVVLHALDMLGQDYDYAVLLQATSPLRTAGDIDACIRACDEAGATCAVTVCTADKHPYWTFSLDPQSRLSPFGGWDDLKRRRQELSPAYAANGAVFVVRTDWFRQARAFYGPGGIGSIMPRERSVDIDTALDLTLAEALLMRAGGSP